MTKKEIVITLREQDRLLQEIFQTRKELEELAVEFFWENFSGSYGYEIIEK